MTRPGPYVAHLLLALGVALMVGGVVWTATRAGAHPTTTSTSAVGATGVPGSRVGSSGGGRPIVVTAEGSR